jgi:hypothetical protein
MLKIYTAAELKALARMMTRLRAGLKFNDPATGDEKQLQIANWWGAGAVAQALLKAYLGPRPRHILGDLSKPWHAVDASTGETCEDQDAREWATYTRADTLIDLIVEPYHFNPRLGLMGDLKESAPDVPEWMLEKPRKRRVGNYNEAADYDNVMAGVTSKVEV